jgi:hypothetical protein
VHDTDDTPHPAVHTFATTRQACDAARTRDDVRDGDVLVAADEGVIGILHGARPWAVTGERGEFSGFDGDWRTIDGGRYGRSFALALGEQASGMRVRVPRVVVRVRRGSRVRDVDTGRTGTVEAVFARGSLSRVRWDGTGTRACTSDIGTVRLTSAD